MMTIQTETDSSLMSLIRVTKVYFPNVLAIESLSYQINKGDMVFVTGPSGAGKTTLLKILAGFEAYSSGVVDIGNKPLADLTPKELRQHHQSIGFVFQEFRLISELTAAENIFLPMEAQYYSDSARQKRCAELLSDLGLSHKADTRISELSRGEQQRIAIARALATKPAIILADEPTGNLDRASSDLVMTLFEKHRKAGAAVILVTHDLQLHDREDCRLLELKPPMPTTL